MCSNERSLLYSAGYFQPRLAQCWMMVCCLCLLGGVGLAILQRIVAAAAHFPVERIPSTVTYLLQFIPVGLYIARKTTLQLQDNRKASEYGFPQYIVPPVPLHKQNTGRMHPALFYLLLLFLTPASAIVTEPMTEWLPMPDSIRELFEKLFFGNRWDAFLSASILAPLFEEILCRGMMERGLIRHSGPLKAIGWSAFIFAFIHMNPWQAIPAFLVGLLIGWIYWRSHSLAACIFIHFVNNTMLLVLGYLIPDLDINATFRDLLPGIWYPAVYLISLLLLAGSLIVLNRMLPDGNTLFRPEVNGPETPASFRQPE